jgi:hypothetical protein
MRITGWLRRVFALPLYPMLAAAYPVVFLYAQNVQEAITPGEVLIPLAISLGATIGVLLVFRVLTGHWAPAALGCLLLVVLFFTYGMAWDAVGALLVGHWVLLISWLVLAIGGLAMIWRLRSHAWRITMPLNAVITVGLVFNLVLIGAFLLNLRPAVAHSGSGVTATGEPVQAETRPDIYWIILEEYGSESVLRDDFQYDNTPFLDQLRQRGFYIADDSTANYLKTAPSIMSARDMEYLDGPELREHAKSPSDWGPIYTALKSPFEVQQFLDNLDYRFIYAGTFWSPMARHPSAEINYVYDRLSSEFLDVLQGATLLRALQTVGPAAPYDWRRNRWDQTLYELRSLERASSLGGPKFVHAQLALDHEPYVFNPDGSFITEEEAKSMTHEQQYVAQLKYTNGQLLTWIDQLLDAPKEKRPIIMLLADEGPWPAGYRFDERGFDWTTASPAALKQKFGIMNAVYLPDMTGEQAGFYPSITPVNEFRVLFNASFGLKLPLLPDRNYIWPDQSDIYNFIDATDEVVAP